VGLKMDLIYLNFDLLELEKIEGYILNCYHSDNFPKEFGYHPRYHLYFHSPKKLSLIFRF